MCFDMLWITKLAAANVAIELSDSGMLRHVTTQNCSREETVTANLAPVRVAPSVCGFVSSQGVQMGIAPVTLRTLVFNRATRHCALQKHKLQILQLTFTSSKIKNTLLTYFTNVLHRSFD